ncbi:hypothetical protein JJD41_17370 [Oxynema sp. CENA135]|uniref:hormogonium polysaccharide biosynthesis protein HpsJ n=1 Tax=Oxynema sp. CENA135 TaxID=984206 RepID=UPI00190C52B3|nr:HpsJ family protein [Oxynema sp. CENA135]MBK4731622.1 hypothetical protein [Oxynema sp. CENA135]
MTPQSSIAAIALKVVGVVLILSSIIDYITLAIPVQLLERQWQLGYTTQIVDRGVIPLVALVFIFTGYWISSNEGGDRSSPASIADLRFWALLFSTVLGVVYLLLFPLHLNNVRLERSATLTEIAQQANQAEEQLRGQLENPQFQQEIGQRREALKGQLSQLLQDQGRLDQALENPDVPDDEKQLLQEFKDNPGQIDAFLDERLSTEGFRDRRLTEIRTRRQDLESEAKTRFAKLAVQTGISSLLLSVAYSAIGWSGLKNMGYLQGGRRKRAGR